MRLRIGAHNRRHQGSPTVRRGKTFSMIGAATLVLVSSGFVTVFAASPASATTTELYSWGYNADGQLGNGTTTNETTPVKVSLPAGVTATAAAAGGDHSLAIGSDGKLYAWGNNSEGQLGNGTTVSSSTPVVVSMPAGVTATAVAAGQSHSVALGSNGAVYDWGDNSEEELGNGTNYNSPSPFKVTLPAGVTPVQVAAGSYMTEIRDSADNVYAWGDGEYGELGNGQIGNERYPVQVNVSAVTAIAAGGYDSLVISLGSVFGYGYNGDGELGNNTYKNASTRVKTKLPSGVTATAIAAGGDFSLAIGSNSTLYAWGGDYTGQLGNDYAAGGGACCFDEPVSADMPSGVRATSISAGANFGLAIGSDGNLYSWGDNTFDELGNGSTSDGASTWVPNKVALSVVAVPPTAVYSGSSAYHSFALALPTPAPTTTTLSLSPSSATANRIVTLSATLSRSDGGGTVGFFNGTNSISGCSAVALSLVGGSYQAQCSTWLPVGTYPITATYSGDTLYATSTSSVQNLTVGAAPPGPAWAFGSLGNLFAPNVSVLPNSVTCVSTSDCWAVGDTSSSTAATAALALNWNGTWWTESSLPSLGVSSSELTSVSCDSSSDCWAVGLSGVDNPTAGEQLLTLNWNGSSWTRITTPNPTSGTVQFVGNPALTCTSTTNCWIAGAWQPGTPQDFVLQWNGTTWSVGSVPAATSPYTGTTLGAVTCTSASNCWAVGTESSSTGSNAFVVQWNGSLWATVSTPSAPGLGSVTCTSSSDCWAAGPDTSGSTTGGLLQWNGTAWSTITLPGINTGLDSVTCSSSSNCWIVGQDTSGASIVGVTYQWNGTSWSVGTLPQPLPQATPLSIACSGSDCWTLVVPTTGSTGSPKAYVEYTDGTSAGTPVLPSGGVPLAVQGNALGTDALGGGSALEACQCEGQATQTGASQAGATDPVDAATGDNYSSATDLTVPGAGVPLAFTRTYDAQVAQDQVNAAASPGPLGYGWSYNLGESVSYDALTQTAVVTEGNGAQDVFDAYSSSTSPAWCSGPTPDFCAASPRTIATLNQSTTDGSWTLVDNVNSPMTYDFNSSGVLTQITDAQGDSLTSSPGTPGSGQCLSTATSCTVWESSVSQRTLTLAFDSTGQLMQVADSATPNPNFATFCFYTQSCASDAPGGGGQSSDLYSANDPGSLTTTYTYDASNPTSDLQHDVLTVSPPGAGEVQNTYNGSGQAITQSNAASGQVTDFIYTGNASSLDGGSTQVTTYPQGTGGPDQVDTYTYSSGVMLSDTTNSSSSAQSTEIVARDPVSLLPTDVEDPNQNISAQSLDAYDLSNTHSTSTDGNVTASSDAVGNTTQSAYNGFNQAWCTVDAADYADGVACPNSPLTSPPTAGSGPPSSMCSASSTTPCLGATISYYNTSDQLTAKTDPLGNTTTYAYTSGVSGVPNGLMYCSADPVSFRSDFACTTYAGTHVRGTTTHTFDSVGDTRTSTDADGGTTTDTYNSTTHPGLVATSTGPDGTTTSYTYDATGQVLTQVMTFGSSYSATTEYAYDASGQKYCEVDPYEYAQGVTCPTSPPSASSPPAGVTSTFYDSNGRVDQTTNAIGGTTITTYDDAGNKVCEIGPAAYAAGKSCPTSPPTAGISGATVDIYNALEQLTEEISPIGGVTLYSYDAAGNKIEQDVESNDTHHDPTVITTYGYDADNRVISTTVDPGSSAATTLQSYDPNGNVYCSVSANAYAAGASAYQCPPWQPSWITSPPSPLSLYSSSPSAAQANNVTMTFSNANGNQVQSTNPDVDTTVSAFDGDGRTYCSADATNVATWLTNNPSVPYPYLCPSPPSPTAPTGSTTGYTTTIFDAAGRTLSSTDPAGDTTSYTYDPAGHQLTMVDPRGEVTTSCYYWENASTQCAASAPAGGGSGDDLYSQTTPPTTADPGGETTFTTYYPGDKPDITATAAGFSTDTYDANGDLTSTTYSGTASGYSTPPNVSNTYNVDGTKATMIDGTGTTTYTYDFARDVTQQALAAGSGTGLSNDTTSYGYFSTGDLETMTYPSYGSYSNPTVTYTYDATGALNNETDWLGNAVSFAHDADGNQTTQDNAGTSSTSFSYDAADQNTQATSSLNCAGTNGTLTQYFGGPNGSRNADGQVTQDFEQYGGSCAGPTPYQRNYNYDAAGRVVYQGTSASGSNNIAYDASGDPTTISSHDSSGNFDTYTQSFDQAGEVTGQTPNSGSSGVASIYGYDTLGDQTSDSSGSTTSTYGFNQIRQMGSFNPGTTTTTTYTYNGDGLEASSEPSTATSPTQLTWDTNDSLATLLSDGTNDYIYGSNDQPVEQVNVTSSPPASNPQFMTYTNSDSSWLMTNAAGAETAYWRYDAFGNLAFGTPGSPFGFAGQYQDSSSNPTGFYDMRARWYDSATGSFTTRDPLFNDTVQAYAYADDDPVNSSDPSGTDTLLGPRCFQVASYDTGDWGGICIGVMEQACGFRQLFCTFSSTYRARIDFNSHSGRLESVGTLDLVLNNKNEESPYSSTVLSSTRVFSKRLNVKHKTLYGPWRTTGDCTDGMYSGGKYWADALDATMGFRNADWASYSGWMQSNKARSYASC